jgi:hypothetical protein
MTEYFSSEVTMSRKILPEIVLFLNEARARRDHAARLRQDGLNLTDAHSRREMEVTAHGLEVEAAKLEAHAVRFQSLANQTDRLSAEIQNETQKAKETIKEINKKITRN